MKVAKDVQTGQMVEAWDLLVLKEVDRERYVCPRCGVKVSPAAFGEDNWVAPYFSPRHGPHGRGCEMARVRDGAAAAPAEPDSSAQEHEPEKFPCRLELGGDDPGTGSSRGGPGLSQAGPTEGAHAAVRRRWVAHTIRPICRAYLQFPQERDTPLSIQGIGGQTYLSVFRKIAASKLAWYRRPALFYAALRRDAPRRQEDYLEMSLDAGFRMPNGKLDAGGHLLRVQWAGWSELAKQAVLAEMNAGVEGSRKPSTGDGGRPVKGWVFFLGEQDGQDWRVFRVRDPRLVCCVVGVMLPPFF